MNLIALMDMAKGLPDQALQQAAQSASSGPELLAIHSEIARRTKTRREYDAMKASPKPSVAEQNIQSLNPPGMAAPGTAPAMPQVPSGPTANPGAAAGGQPQVGLKDGGIIGLEGGGMINPGSITSAAKGIGSLYAPILKSFNAYDTPEEAMGIAGKFIPQSKLLEMLQSRMPELEKDVADARRDRTTNVLMSVAAPLLNNRGADPLSALGGAVPGALQAAQAGKADIRAAKGEITKAQAQAAGAEDARNQAIGTAGLGMFKEAEAGKRNVQQSIIQAGVDIAQKNAQLGLQAEQLNIEKVKSYSTLISQALANPKDNNIALMKSLQAVMNSKNWEEFDNTMKTKIKEQYQELLSVIKTQPDVVTDISQLPISQQAILNIIKGKAPELYVATMDSLQKAAAAAAAGKDKPDPGAGAGAVQPGSGIKSLPRGDTQVTPVDAEKAALESLKAAEGRGELQVNSYGAKQGRQMSTDDKIVAITKLRDASQTIQEKLRREQALRELLAAKAAEGQ